MDAVKPQKPKLNTTPDGELACMFGTPWLDHFSPPIGTGKGCQACRDYPGEPSKVQQ